MATVPDHTHDHSHGEKDTFYLDQLCLIGISGAFAAICLTLYFFRQDMLIVMFGAPDETVFDNFVLWSGVALLVMVLLRAVALWRSVGDPSLGAHKHHGHTHGPADHAHHHHHHDHHHHPHEGPCDHDHGHDHHHHGPTHSHEPAAEPAHAHDDHDHGWAPWRYAVLLVPVALFLLGLPNQIRAIRGLDEVNTTEDAKKFAPVIALGPNPLAQVLYLQAVTPSRGIAIYLNGKPASLADLKPGDILVKLASGSSATVSIEEIRDTASAVSTAGFTPAVLKSVEPERQRITVELTRDGKKKTEKIDLSLGTVYGLDFKTLEALSHSAESRRKWEGKAVQVVGQYAPFNDKAFALARQQINCCGADAKQLNVPIYSNESIKGLEINQWIKVTGRIEFQFNKGQGRTSTILRVLYADQVVPTSPEPELYIR